MNAKSYVLEKIANWQLEPDEGAVAIPRLQRGLVWSAIKMELLWDSIMRGIPIGAFVVCNRAKLKSQDRSEGVKAEWYLLDGQQRSAAITMAFREFPPRDEEDGLPVLWLDLAPDEATNVKKAGKSRVFWFKVTTRAHPWGYTYRQKEETEGRNTIFSVCERRDSMKNLENWPSEKRPSSAQLWPHEAQSPIPFTLLLRAYALLRRLDAAVEADAFWDKVSELVQSSGDSNWRRCRWPLIEKPVASILSKVLKSLEVACNYEVVALLVPEALIDESISTETADSEGEGISVLFERLNVLGEQPSPEELVYSVLKALWPELYDIDKIAEGRMFPYRMAVLAIQVFLCLEKPNKWDSKVTTSLLRALMRNPVRDNNGLTERQRIERFICRPDDNTLSPFEQACNQVDAWLGFDENRDYNSAADWGVLKTHRTAIAERYLPMYKLLLLMALKPNVVSDIGVKGQNVTSLTLLISWFSRTSLSEVAKRVYQSVSKNNTNSWQEAVAESLLHLVDDGELLIPCPPDILRMLLDSQNNSLPVENLPQLLRSSVWWPSIQRIWSPFGKQEAHEVLLYAQRLYMKQSGLFDDYDPSQRDMWETYNRPWDLDHILPRSWLCRRQGHIPGPYMEVGESFRDCIGNIVAIPLSVNRKKGNNQNGSEYCAGHRSLLKLDDSIEQYKKCDYDYNKLPVEHFVTTTAERFIKLYDDCYNALNLGQWFVSASGKSRIYRERKSLFELFCGMTHDGKAFSSQVYCYQGGALYPVSSWADAWFCDRMYFTPWASDSSKICCPFISHEQNGSSSYACYVGILKPSAMYLEQARAIAKDDETHLEFHEDGTHLAYVCKKNVDDAVVVLRRLVLKVLVNESD